MSSITVRFLDKEYSIPGDVITYVDLVDFTNKIKNNLISSFSDKIRLGVEVMESESFMIDVINEQTSKFIRKLLENDIYNKTTNDYLNNSIPLKCSANKNGGEYKYG